MHMVMSKTKKKKDEKRNEKYETTSDEWKKWKDEVEKIYVIR